MTRKRLGDFGLLIAGAAFLTFALLAAGIPISAIIGQICAVLFGVCVVLRGIVRCQI